MRCYCGHNGHFQWTDERAVIHSAHNEHGKCTSFENETNSFGLLIKYENERTTYAIEANVYVNLIVTFYRPNYMKN